MSTPETDARSAWLIGHAVVPEWPSRGGEQECVDADFARRLERERDAARAERDEARDVLRKAVLALAYAAESAPGLFNDAYEAVSAILRRAGGE